MSERPNKADVMCCKRISVPMWDAGTWFAGLGLFTSRLLLLLLLLMIAGAAGALNPLAPPDTSSPRATFESFLLIREEAARRFSEYRDSPSRATQKTFQQTLDRSLRLLDLSQVPPAARREVAVETWVALLRFLARKQINVTGSVAAAPDYLIAAGHGVAVAWIVWLTSNWIAEAIIASPKISSKSLDAHLIRLAARSVGIVAIAVLVLRAAFEVGIPVYGLVAGAGVGGLAIALAARPALENIIGSFMIFADKPYSVGQRIKVLGQDGTVESIGLRSTTIRLLSGHLTSIPNEKMAAVEIENIGRRPYIRRVFNITITYDTPPEKISLAKDILREILAVPDAPHPDAAGSTREFAVAAAKQAEADQQPHPNEAINQPDSPPRVYFNDFNADSLNILVNYWYHPAQYWDYLEHADWINLQIMERFNAEGIDFAFPTQTLHLAGDDKRSLTVGQRWVSEEKDFSHRALLAQAAVLGAQAVQTSQMPASESARPQARKAGASQPGAERKLTDAPLEDDLLHGDEEGETGEAVDDGAAER